MPLLWQVKLQQERFTKMELISTKNRPCTAETCPIADMRCPNCFPHKNCALYNRKTGYCRLQDSIFGNMMVMDNEGMDKESMMKAFMETTYPMIDTMNKAIINVLVDISKDFEIDLPHLAEWSSCVKTSGETRIEDIFGKEGEITISMHDGEVYIDVREGDRHEEHRIVMESRHVLSSDVERLWESGKNLRKQVDELEERLEMIGSGEAYCDTCGNFVENSMGQIGCSLSKDEWLKCTTGAYGLWRPMDRDNNE